MIKYKDCKCWHTRPLTKDYGDCDSINIGFDWSIVVHGSPPEIINTSKRAIGHSESTDIRLWTGAEFGCIHGRRKDDNEQA